MSNRTFKIGINNTFSEEHSVTAGVPQGAVLSPMLYNIFTHDLPEYIPEDCQVACFADDTAVYCSMKKPRPVVTILQKTINNLEKYFTRWNIKINASKTQSIFITKRRARRSNIHHSS